MRTLASLVLAAAAANAHYTFPDLIVGGKATGDWYNVRKTANWQSNGPVTDVTSAAIRCYELSAGSPATTATVSAGSSVGFTVAPDIFHPGPLAFYMAQAPSNISSWDGTGSVWFKISQDQPSGTQGNWNWPSLNAQKVSVTIPSCIPAGQYFLRVEHIALHGASAVNGAQFYISCAQLAVTGGGSTTPGNLVAFPGAYKSNDPGIQINIYSGSDKTYPNPGPSVFSC